MRPSEDSDDKNEHRKRQQKSSWGTLFLVDFGDDSSPQLSPIVVLQETPPSYTHRQNTMAANENPIDGLADDRKMVDLVSQEGDNFQVEKKVAKMSELVKTMIPEDDDDDQQEIPLPNVKSQILAKVIEFSRHHAEDAMNDIEKPLKSANMNEVVQEWYAQYVDVEQEVLFELILAANYMDIKPLLDLTCATVASMIKDRTPEEIRKTFNIVNDFTPEEEAQVREENKWCEEA